MRSIILVRAMLCLYLPLLLAMNATAQTYEATLLDAETKRPIEAATVQLQKAKQIAITDKQGRARFTQLRTPDSILIAALGYQPLIRPFDPAVTTFLLQPLSGQSEVVVNTGYQSLERKRSTGSSVTIVSELINRSVSANLLERLEGITPGLVFNKNIYPGTNQSALTIRGRSTLLANPNPLIVVDNFPFDGELSNINPNDVESVTVLKDAAAASIWGALAGNGVIVVTTKKGHYGQAPTLSFTTNTMVMGKPDLWYTPRLGSAAYVDLQSWLYGRGYYNNAINNPSRPALPPVVDILIRRTGGSISPTEAQQELDRLKQQDIRNDLHHYLYQPTLLRQLALNLKGGGPNNQYFLSAGFDNNQQQLVGSNDQRVTLNANNTYQLLKDRVELNTGIIFTSTNTTSNGSGFNPGIPYLKLVNDDGEAMAIASSYNLRYTDTAGQGRLLDWNYRPLEERGLLDNTTKLSDYRINTGLTAKIIEGLSIELRYQYSHGLKQERNLQSATSFYTRDMINRYSQLNRTTGQVTRPIPLGGILDRQENRFVSHNTRIQANYRKTLLHHSLQIIAGAERRQVRTERNGYRLYGYNNDLGTSLPVDMASLFPLFHSPTSTVRIPHGITTLGTDNRFLSWFTSMVYTYHGRYTFSASLRKDASNLFGVNTNQRAVPLYSIGTNWSMSKEKWFAVQWLSDLSIRVSFGYNGNVDNTVSAFTSASFSGVNTYGQLQGTITSAPNPDIRWEKIGVWNLGLDFGLSKGWLSGSIEYFHKSGRDLIGNGPIAPQSGITSFKGNSANMVTKGMDMVLNFYPINGKLRWESNLLLSYAADKVTRYLLRRNVVNNYVDPAFFNPLEGKPLYSLFSYAWRGLDPLTGDPQGFLNNNVSKDYAAILNSPDLATLIYNGPTVPRLTGSTRNTLTVGNWSLSALIAGKFGYYFRKPSLQYGELFAGAMGHPDYTRRWQQPGDEQHTQVPSLIYPITGSRDPFYKYAEHQAEKGDHIRLQDIRLSYMLTGRALPQALKIRSINLYAYATNLGLLWRANKVGLDPDFIPVNTNLQNIPPALSIALGANINF